MFTILMVEDNNNLLKLLSIILEKEKFNVLAFKSGLEALEKIPSINPDIALIDLKLPDISGLEICKQLKDNKNTSHIPIIIISASNEEKDIINAINIGCEDYIIKPFDNNFLISKIKGYLNKSKQKNDSVIELKGITIDKDAMRITIEGKAINFTIIEFKLLTLLVENQDKVLDRQKLYEALHFHAVLESYRTIDTLIAKIRKKMGKYSTCLETVFGAGYRFKSME